MNGVQKGPDKFGGYIYCGNPYKVFENFFGSNNPYVEEPKRAEGQLTELEQIEKDCRAEDIVVTLECELFEFYNGAIKEVSYARRKMLAATEASTTQAERFNIEVLPGFDESTELKFAGRGHESFGANNSDLIVKFKQTPKDGYLRKGDNIIFTQTVTLVEALECKPIAVSTLDNRKVFITPSETITP